MVKKIVVNDTEFEYIFEQKDIKNINIQIRRDGSIYVSAPFGVPVKKVEEFVLSKADILAATVSRIRNSDDNRIYHLGKCYSVYNDLTNGVILTDDAIHIHSKSAFDKWEKEKALRIITDACTRLYPMFSDICPKFPDIHFRKMVSKWGVCRPLQNKITFNTALVRAPMECIEYVICHEFVHFLHPDHSKRFYNTLSAILPDWKERKNLLKNLTLIK